MEVMLEQIEVMLAAAGSLEEFGEMLRAGFRDLDQSVLARVLGEALTAAMPGPRRGGVGKCLRRSAHLPQALPRAGRGVSPEARQPRPHPSMGRHPRRRT